MRGRGGRHVATEGCDDRAVGKKVAGGREEAEKGDKGEKRAGRGDNGGYTLESYLVTNKSL